ncbi:MAG: sigma-70 family RNA polymerase sigma factor [Planctomycetota bacterium]
MPATRLPDEHRPDFAQFLRENEQHIDQAIRKFVWRMDRRDDVKSIACLELMQAWIKYANGQAIEINRALIFTIVRRVEAKVYRKECRRREIEEQYETLAQRNAGPLTVERLHEVLEATSSVLSHIPAQRRRVYRMHRIEGKTVTEIAAVVRKDKSTISRWLQAIDRALQIAIESDVAG